MNVAPANSLTTFSISTYTGTITVSNALTIDGDLGITSAGNASSIMTLGANLTIGGNLTILDNNNGTADTVLNISTYDCTVTGDISLTGTDSNDRAQISIAASSSTGLSANDITIGAFGRINCSGTSLITCSGNWLATATTAYFVRSISTVTLSGTGTVETDGSGNAPFYNLTCAQPSTTTTIPSSKVVDAYGTVTLGSGIFANVGGSGTLNIYSYGDANAGNLIISDTTAITVNITFLVTGATASIPDIQIILVL